MQVRQFDGKLELSSSAVHEPVNFFVSSVYLDRSTQVCRDPCDIRGSIRARYRRSLTVKAICFVYSSHMCQISGCVRLYHHITLIQHPAVKDATCLLIR